MYMRPDSRFTPRPLFVGYIHFPCSLFFSLAYVFAAFALEFYKSGCGRNSRDKGAKEESAAPIAYKYSRLKREGSNSAVSATSKPERFETSRRQITPGPADDVCHLHRLAGLAMLRSEAAIKIPGEYPLRMRSSGPGGRVPPHH